MAVPRVKIAVTECLVRDCSRVAMVIDGSTCKLHLAADELRAMLTVASRLLKKRTPTTTDGAFETNKLIRMIDETLARINLNQ